jgi:nucleotide-binding universal stress UspA family protein
MESIVVPLDGSHFAEHALPIAIGLARRSGAVLKIVRVFTPHPVSAFDLVNAHLRIEARRYLERVKRRIVSRTRGVSVVTCLLESPGVSHALTMFSREADLVVMATHGRGWLGRWLRGSVAHEMLRECEKPFLFVRGYRNPVDLSVDPVPLHVAIALDGRKSSEPVVEAAGLITRMSGAKTTLLHVDDPYAPGEPFAHSNAESYLNWTGRKLSKAADRVATRVVRDASHPPGGILDFVDESEADLIAVTSSRGPASPGSTIGHLMRKSPVPVLVVPEGSCE